MSAMDQPLGRGLLATFALAPGESRWRWLEIAGAWLLALLWLGPPGRRS